MAVRETKRRLEKKKQRTDSSLSLWLCLPVCLCVKPLRGQITHTRADGPFYISHIQITNSIFHLQQPAHTFTDCCCWERCRKHRIFYMETVYAAPFVYSLVCSVDIFQRDTLRPKYWTGESESAVPALFCILNFLDAKIKFRIFHTKWHFRAKHRAFFF